MLFQAGASEQGRDLAARRAEAIYAVAYDVQAGREYRSDVRRRITGAGRDPDTVAVMPGLVAYVGSTMDEARARQRELDVLLPTESSLRQLSTFIGQDASAWDLDAPVPPLPPLEALHRPQGAIRHNLAHRRDRAAERARATGPACRRWRTLHDGRRPGDDRR